MTIPALILCESFREKAFLATGRAICNPPLPSEEKIDNPWPCPGNGGRTMDAFDLTFAKGCVGKGLFTKPLHSVDSGSIAERLKAHHFALCS
ncbi:hypothetical protein CDAR_608971 [Caerostris darwini]|uniref:Uncharacterized protein n=1 Tax=Caerostris darwini TaxID=1538125 RepID=A0AAV4WMQ3_9ARAC|nr:hypothetical protein CDAR_608971 [Caerostris darwini]